MLLRQPGQRAHPPGGQDPGHPLVCRQARLAQFFQEQGVDLLKLLAFQGPAAVGHREQGLDAAGGPGDDADGAGGGDGGDRGVAPGRLALSMPAAAGRNWGKGPALAASAWDWATARSWMRAMIVSASCKRFRGIIGDPQPDEQIRQPHDPQADLAVGVDDGGDLGQGVVALVDDVVQEGHPQGHQPVQRGPSPAPPR